VVFLWLGSFFPPLISTSSSFPPFLPLQTPKQTINEKVQNSNNIPVSFNGYSLQILAQLETHHSKAQVRTPTLKNMPLSSKPKRNHIYV